MRGRLTLKNQPQKTAFDLKQKQTKFLKMENLKNISKKEAKQLFSDGFWIYVKVDKGRPESGWNLFMIKKDSIDANLNIYRGMLEPGNYCFDTIVNWINERIETRATFFTAHSREPLVFSYQ